MGPQLGSKMRCAILVISLAIIYASASPTADPVVPEDSLYGLDDDLSEAQQTIDDMTASGKSDKDCRKLVTETRKDVTDNVDFCTKAMNDLPKGESCPARGQENVKVATEAKTKAEKHVVYCKTQVTKAEQTSVDFGSATFSSLTEGKCSSFYSSTSYTTAKMNHKAAVTAYTKAVGSATQASKSLKLAIEAAAKEKKECECKVKSDHESAFAKHSASNAANQKAWNFACKVECVLDGKSSCKCSAAPMCKRAKVTAEVMEADCVAKKDKVCPREKGFCVLSSGADQNSGVIKVNSIQGNTDAAQKECLKSCHAHKGATGCETIWDQGNRGCYIMTQPVARGNGVSRHNCWVFSKCK